MADVVAKMVNKMKKTDILEELSNLGVNEDIVEGVLLPELKKMLLRELDALNSASINQEDVNKTASEIIEEEMNMKETTGTDTNIEITTIEETIKVDDATNLERANKLTVSKVGDTWVAKYYRTHKIVQSLKVDDSIMSNLDTADKNSNIVRELVRDYLKLHSVEYGVAWDPESHQSNSDIPKKWATEAIIMEHAPKLVERQVKEWVAKIANDVDFDLEVNVHVDGVTLSEIDNKGNKVDSHYKNGNIAWADIDIMVDVVNSNDDREMASVALVAKIISGQLSKPKQIGTSADNHYNYTNFRTELATDWVELASPTAIKDATEIKNASEIADEVEHSSDETDLVEITTATEETPADDK